MAKGAIFAALCVLFLMAAPSLQFGELDVDWIIANDIAVQIEDTLIADTTLVLEYIEGLTDQGVFVEQVNFNEGSVVVPIDATVGETGTVEGALFANGGIFADSVPDGDFSFTVANDSGDTTIKGLTSIFGGINADNGKFTVADGTGETRIAEALLRPDGGIDVGNGLFTVNELDGSFRTQSNANVHLDIFVGTDIAEARTIARVPSSADNGGNFIVKGQDATSQGGDLVLVPGTGAVVGKIVIGRAAPDDLYVGRSTLDSSANDGGRTTFQGQDANNGVGGDLVVAAGDSTGSGQGGNIVLSVGLSDSGAPGQLFLGTDQQGFSDFDLIVTRPDLISGTAGSTSFFGQSTNQGAGGDLWLQAGNVDSGNGIPGDLVLQPGASEANVVGDIFIGSDIAADLHFTRFPVSAPGGDTFFTGQSSVAGSGGDLFLRAGNAGNTGSGGDLWLQPGATVGGTIGAIVWGQAADALTVSRPVSTGAGTTTTILGQNASAGSGGNLVFQAGSGSLDGGDLNLTAGAGTGGVGGSLLFTAGNGNSFGGSIDVSGGLGLSGTGGAITFTSGQGATDGGDIVLNAGTGAGSNGNIIVGPSASQFVVNTDVLIDQGQLILNAGANSLVIAAEAANIVRYNGVQVLAARVNSVQTLGTPTGNCATDINALQGQFNDFINALGPSGHGLFNVVDTTGAPIVAPGPVIQPFVAPSFPN